MTFKGVCSNDLECGELNISMFRLFTNQFINSTRVHLFLKRFYCVGNLQYSSCKYPFKQIESLEKKLINVEKVLRKIPFPWVYFKE